MRQQLVCVRVLSTCDRKIVAWSLLLSHVSCSHLIQDPQLADLNVADPILGWCLSVSRSVFYFIHTNDLFVRAHPATSSILVSTRANTSDYGGLGSPSFELVLVCPCLRLHLRSLSRSCLDSFFLLQWLCGWNPLPQSAHSWCLHCLGLCLKTCLSHIFLTSHIW